MLTDPARQSPAADHEPEQDALPGGALDDRPARPGPLDDAGGHDAGGHDGLGGTAAFTDVTELTDGDVVEELPRRRPARVAAIVAAVVVAALIGVFSWGVNFHDSDPTSGPSSLVGRVAPPVAGVTLDGATFDLGSQRGNWVVVNFFATWCVPCIQEHPELAAFEARNASRNRRVVGVVFGGPSEADAARRFLQANGGTWPVVIDDGRIAVDYGVPRVPESVLVEPNGVVYAKLRGGVTADDLDRVIDAAEAPARTAGGS